MLRLVFSCLHCMQVMLGTFQALLNWSPWSNIYLFYFCFLVKSLCSSSTLFSNDMHECLKTLLLMNIDFLARHKSFLAVLLLDIYLVYEVSFSFDSELLFFSFSCFWFTLVLTGSFCLSIMVEDSCTWTALWEMCLWSYVRCMF